MKGFSSAWIDRLNRQSNAGVFVKAVILSESDSVTRYWVDAQRPIVFNGQTYHPLPMIWEGVELSNAMSLPVVKVSVPNVGGEVIDYLEGVDILGRSVTLQILHLDLLGDVSNVDAVTLSVMAIEGNLEAVTFTLGLDLNLNEPIPRGVITLQEFPAVPRNIRRATIL
jgi:hypothetical protein